VKHFVWRKFGDTNFLFLQALQAPIDAPLLAAIPFQEIHSSIIRQSGPLSEEMVLEQRSLGGRE
jgi:hypothetical protein